MRAFVLGIVIALAAATAASATDPREVLVGRAIGAVRLGMKESTVVAVYGTPQGKKPWRLSGRSGQAAEYNSHGGVLVAFFEGGRVVAVETTSPRYRLAAAVGVGTITPRRPNEFSYSWRGFRYDACTGAYRRGAYGAVTELVLLAGATTGRRIVAVAIADARHLLLLPGAGRCD